MHAILKGYLKRLLKITKPVYFITLFVNFYATGNIHHSSAVRF